ncbi:MAG: type II secretion system protein J [Anaerolineae bacterium]
MKRAKRPFTLLEVLIGLCIAAVLVGVLFNFYHQIMLSHIQLEKLTERAHFRQLFQQRLIQVFDHIDESSNLHLSEITDSRSPALAFCYDNGTDRDKNFCHQLDALLYVDRAKNLSLISWGKQTKARKEILWEGVESIAFGFYSPSEEDWTALWSPDQEENPEMIKCSIKEVQDQTISDDHKDEKKPIDFVFFLQPKLEIIAYKKHS